MDLAAFEEALDAFVSSDPSSLCDRESIVALEKVLRRLEAFVTRAVGAFDEQGGFAADGARSATAWLVHRCRMPRREASRQARLGRALASLPATAEAFSSGVIGAAHVGVVAHLQRSEATREALSCHEGLLVDKASSLSFSSFEKAVAYFAQLADPDGAEADAETLRRRRDAYLVESYGGTFVGQMSLDPIAGAIVSGEWRRLEQALFEADRSEATARLGREPLAGELERTSAQRRADALVEMARRSAACSDDARFPAPLVSVLVGYETLHGRICELANGTVVTPGSLLPYLDEALVERAVFASPTRVEVGAKVRLFSGATRRAIELRDRICQHPFCEVPASRCEVDHVVPASMGGETTQENGRLLCGWHNRLRNRSPDLVPGGP